MELEVIMIVCHENPPQMGLGFHLVHKALVVCNCNKIYVFWKPQSGRQVFEKYSSNPTLLAIYLACLFSRNYLFPPYNGKKYNERAWLWGQYLCSFWVKLIIPTHPCNPHKSTEKFKISQPHTKGLLKREKAFKGENTEWVLSVLKGENLSPKGQRS